MIKKVYKKPQVSFTYFVADNVLTNSKAFNALNNRGVESTNISWGQKIQF